MTNKRKIEEKRDIVIFLQHNKYYLANCKIKYKKTILLW